MVVIEGMECLAPAAEETRTEPRTVAVQRADEYQESGQNRSQISPEPGTHV